MIYQNSRYYHQLIDHVAFTENGDSYPIVFYQFDDPGTVSWVEHVYTEGERLDTLAYKYYKRADYWWILPEYNPHIADFNNILPGTVIKIPNV
jgi:phage tail protein X